MISLIDKLRDVIDEKHISEDDKGSFITLRETKEPEFKPFVIKKGSTKTLTLELDIQIPEPGIHPMLKKGVRKLKKCPDYLIVCENRNVGNKIYVIVAELKSGNRGHWQRQAKAGLAIAEYLVGMTEGYFKKHFENIEYRCLLFHTGSSSNKKPKMMKKKPIKKTKFEYDEHPIFKYKFADRPCNIDHDLELYLR